jgi:parallel beta-helix repeat protein
MPLFTLLPVILQICGCGLTCSVAPSINGQPSSQTVGVGQPALFTVAASGSTPLSYQWLKNGVSISGATQDSYATPATSSTDSGSAFTVTVTNSYGTLTSTAATLTVNTLSVSNVYFVAPNGNDSNAGTIDQPFRTIQHCAATVAQGSTCAVRAGTYRETVTPNSGITITAYNLESVTVDGSDPVTGWTPYQGSIYKAQVTLRTDDTNQIFVGSDMMTEARWPNGDDLFNVNWATAKAGTDSSHIVDPNLPSVNWTGAKIHLWSGIDAFSHETGVVTASGVGQISLGNMETETCPYICPIPGGYYYLFGTLNALDAEREWYYDPNSTTLYFMAPGNVDPNTLDVRSKQRSYAFDLRGKSGVTIQNISIFACSILTDSASTNNTLDRINAQYVSHFTSLASWSNYSYSDWGGDWGILIINVSDTGIIINGSGNTLQNSTISYSAGTGLALEGSNNTIRNNLIRNVDYIGDYASGIVIDGNNNVIQNNTIYKVGRQAILVNAVVNEDIGYNNVYNSMLLSTDGGEIYICCKQSASGTRIHHNWVHDTTPVVSDVPFSNVMAGIYIDNFSSGFTVDQNVLWQNKLNNIFNTGSNYIHNNTIPDSTPGARIENTSGTDCTMTIIVNNRVVENVANTETNGVSGSPCVLSPSNNNNPSAPGANEMTPTSQIGCNFDGCSSNPPPGIVNGNSVTPCPVTGVSGTNTSFIDHKPVTVSRKAQPALDCAHWSAHRTTEL